MWGGHRAGSGLLLQATLATGVHKGTAGHLEFRGNELCGKGFEVTAGDGKVVAIGIVLIVVVTEDVGAVFEVAKLIVVRLKEVGGVSWLGSKPVVVHLGVKTCGVPGLWSSGKDVWQCCPLMISEWSLLEVGKAMSEAQGQDVSFRRDEAGRATRDLGRLVVAGPAIGFQLPGGNDGETIKHLGSLVVNHNDGTTLCLSVGSHDHQGQVTHGVLIDPIEVCEGAVRSNLSSVRASNDSIGTTINEGVARARQVASVDADGVDRSCGQIRSVCT